ncbi:MAG: glutamine--fructose-6-phosphate transaminase (isomerizing), partial [Candidatus Asgardarchaeia archaeon]
PGNIQECKSRGCKVISVASYVTKELEEKSDYIIKVPDVNPLFSPIVYIVPLQLLAVYTTKLRGYDPDRPRALAKSVTVK